MASVCEFTGAVLMGSGVTETIRDQIADLSYFAEKPDMCAALRCAVLHCAVLRAFGGCSLRRRAPAQRSARRRPRPPTRLALHAPRLQLRVWHAGCNVCYRHLAGERAQGRGRGRGGQPGAEALAAAAGPAPRRLPAATPALVCAPRPAPSGPQILATYWELPVSTTHAIVGAVVGMTMVAAGPDAVNWSHRTDSFPFLGVRQRDGLGWGSAVAGACHRRSVRSARSWREDGIERACTGPDAAPHRTPCRPTGRGVHPALLALLAAAHRRPRAGALCGAARPGAALAARLPPSLLCAARLCLRHHLHRQHVGAWRAGVGPREPRRARPTPALPHRTPPAHHHPCVRLPPPPPPRPLSPRRFIIQQGGSRFNWDHTPVGTAAWISACVGAGCTVAAVALQYLLIHKRVAADLKLEEEAAVARATADAAAACHFADPEPGAVGLQLEGGWVVRGKGGSGRAGAWSSACTTGVA